MTQVNTQPVTFAPSNSAIPATRVQPRPVVNERPVVAAESIDAAPPEPVAMEAALSLVVVCVTGAVIVASTAGIAHVMFTELLKYSSLDLIRAFSGI